MLCINLWEPIDCVCVCVCVCVHIYIYLSCIFNLTVPLRIDSPMKVEKQGNM